MPVPRAFLLTWTTYGTWLPGDERGSVDDEHNGFKMPFAPPNAKRNAVHAARLVCPPLYLNAPQRHVVQDTIVAHCEFRGWEILALNVRSNHVHAVVRCGETHPAQVTNQLKAWATRRLREARLLSTSTPVWTERASRRLLWTEESVTAAVAYVADHQGPDLE